MNLGDAFIPVGSMPRAGHLHVVVATVAGSTDLAVVNLTTKRWDSDSCCTIDAGEHPWVRHETVVRYDAALLIADAQLEAGVTGGVLRKQTPVDVGILERIQLAALVCDQTPQKVEAAIRGTLGNRLPPGR